MSRNLEIIKGLSINDVVPWGKGIGNGFCDNKKQALVLKSVTREKGSKSHKMRDVIFRRTLTIQYKVLHNLRRKWRACNTD